MATATEKTTGLAVPCPKCGAAEGLTLKLHDLTVECGECSEEVTRADLQKLIDDATRLLTWLGMASAL